MKFAFAASLLSAANAAEWREIITSDPSDDYNFYYYAPVAQVDTRDPWNYDSAFEWDFDKIHDEAQEVYFGTDSESEINSETNDSWSSYEGYTIEDSGSVTSDADPVHRNSSDDSDCSDHCTSDQHSHSSESLHDATDSHCHGSDCDSSNDSSHDSDYSSSYTYSADSSHSNDSSYPYSSSSDGIGPTPTGGRTVGGYYYSGYHGNRSYAPQRYYTGH